MDTEYLNRFEERLQQELLRLCTDYHVLDGTLLATEDLDNRWHDLGTGVCGRCRGTDS